MNAVPPSVLSRIARLQEAGLLDESMKPVFLAAAAGVFSLKPPVSRTGEQQEEEEGFQSRAGGEKEKGVLTQLAKTPALSAEEAAKRAAQPTMQNIPMDRRAPAVRDVPPERNNYRALRSYRAAPRRSVYLPNRG